MALMTNPFVHEKDEEDYSRKALLFFRDGNEVEREGALAYRKKLLESGKATSAHMRNGARFTGQLEHGYRLVFVSPAVAHIADAYETVKASDDEVTRARFADVETHVVDFIAAGRDVELPKSPGGDDGGAERGQPTLPPEKGDQTDPEPPESTEPLGNPVAPAADEASEQEPEPKPAPARGRRKKHR